MRSRVGRDGALDDAWAGPPCRPQRVRCSCERSGFRQRGEFEVADGLVITTMWREARRTLHNHPRCQSVEEPARRFNLSALPFDPDKQKRERARERERTFRLTLPL